MCLSLVFCLLFLVGCNGSSTSNPEFGNTQGQTNGNPPGVDDVSATFTTIVGTGTIVANGTSTAIITVTLKTANNLPVENVVPMFSATDTNTTNIYGDCSSSNSSGVSICTMASVKPETKQLFLTYPVSVPGNSVTFIYDNVDTTESYIQGDDNILANGVAVSNVRIKLVDMVGTPLEGIPTFKATNTGNTNVYGACSALDSNGESTCTLTSTKAEVKQLEILSPAHLVGDSINFLVGPISTAQSTITSTSTPVSDGVSAALIKIVLRDATLNPIPGESPTYTATDTGSKNVYGPCSVTNSLGESFCSLTSTKAETKTLSITSPINLAGGTIVFAPGAASATYSSITGTTNVLANGTATSTVSINLQDAGQNPIPGVVPTFTATDGGNDNVYNSCSVTNASGNSTCTMTSLSPEVKTLRLTSPLFNDGGTVKFLSPGMNIMVPIDLIDRGVASSTTATIFDRSLYPLTTTDYVATANDYYFEIIAQNTNATTNFTVNLLGNANVVLSTITVPMNTAASTRIRSTAITMPAGTNNLKVRVNATTAANQVILLAAKLIIKQTAATKTKLWYPLTHYDHSGYTNAVLGQVFSTTSTTLVNNLTYSTQWNRNDALFTELDSSAYKLEAVMSSNNAAGTASLALHNVTDNIAVASSTGSITGTAYAWASAPLTDSSTFLNNKTYEIRLRSNNAAYTSYLFKAGVSITLTNLSKAEIANRIYMRRSSAASAMLGGGRLIWEAADYAHPKIFFETNGNITAGGSASKELDDHGTSDVSIATPVVVTDSVHSLTTTQGPVRTPELFLTDGNRVGVYDRVNSGTMNATSSFLVIQSSLR